MRPYRKLRGLVSWLKSKAGDTPSGLRRPSEFQRYLDQSWERTSPEPLLVLLCIERLKEFNEAFGVTSGDALLTMVAQRVKTGLGPQDLAARTGGSEIGVLVNPSSDSDQIERRVQALLGMLRTFYSLGGMSVQVHVSAGIATRPRDAIPSRIWLSQARLALAQARVGRGNQTVFFDPAMRARLERRLQLTRDLEGALHRREFFLEFQNQVDSQTGVTVGAEALVRWQSPVHGLVSPREFIPLTEETGLILSLGRWILDQALLAAHHWPPAWTVSVNVSAAQLADPEFPRGVLDALGRHGFAPDRLILEITESVLIDDGDLAREVLQSLRSTGVRVSLDDFGTGYSSLLYLRNYPLDELKVDQAFVRALEGHRESMAIVQTVLQLAQILGLTTTAEGIETEAQARILRDFGCRVFQGYYFGKPSRTPPSSSPRLPVAR